MGTSTGADSRVRVLPYLHGSNAVSTVRVGVPLHEYINSYRPGTGTNVVTGTGTKELLFSLHSSLEKSSGVAEGAWRGHVPPHGSGVPPRCPQMKCG